MSRIGERIRGMAEGRPELIRLAEVVSLAILIDPPLLRKARLTLVPEADAGVEADLWLSPLVQNYGPDGIVFAREVAEELRARLAEDPERLRKAWEITDALHQHLSPAVRLEEEIAWLSVSPDPRAADRIEELLRSVLAAMVGGERRGLAHWVARALPSLPSGVRVRSAETLRMLDTGARLRLGEGVGPEKGEEKERMPDWLPWVAPADLKRVPVRVRLFPDAVELDVRPEATGNILELPATDPLLVELSWTGAQGKERRQVVFRREELRRVEPVRAKNICLRTILGEVYDLHESHQPPRALQADAIDFSAERERHRPFFGRREALAEIETWIAGAPSNLRIGAEFMIVLGAAGAGKTALLSHMVDRLQESSGAPPPHHFFRRGVPRLEDLASAERSLIAQVAAHFPVLATAAARLSLADLLDQLSSRGLVSWNRPLILVLDGVDQARTVGSENPLHQLFPRDLPAGALVLASWETEILASPPSEWPVQFHLSVEAEDFREYWIYRNSHGLRLPFLSPDSIRGNNSFGAAEIVLRLLQREGDLGEFSLADWPDSHRILQGIWKELVTAQSVGGEILALCLGALAASFGPLPESILMRVAGPDVSFLLERASVLVEPIAEESGRSYALINDTARRFVIGRMAEHLARIHRQCAPPLNPPAEGWLLYELRYGIDHLLAAKDLERSGELCCSAEFLTAKCRRIGIEDALRDLQGWLTAYRSRNARRDRVQDILNLMTREQDRLRRAPEGLSALLYNWFRATKGLSLQRMSKDLRISEAPAFRVKKVLPGRSPSLDRRGMKRHGGPVMDFQVVQEHGPHILSWSMEAIRLWDLAHGGFVAAWQPHAGEITGCAMVAGNVLSSSRDGTLKISSLVDGEALNTFTGHEGEVLGVALSEDAQRAVSWSTDRTLRVWDLRTGRELSVLSGHQGTVTSCALTGLPGVELVISGSEDATVRVWRLASGKLLGTYGGHMAPITSVLASPALGVIVSGSQDRNLNIWRLKTPSSDFPLPGDLQKTLKGHSSGIIGCALHPNVRRLASWSYDRTIQIWSLSWPFDRVSVLHGHEGAVLDCAFSDDGKLLVSGSADRTVRIWNVESGREIARFEGHMGGVRCCRFISDQILVSGSEDRTLRIWNLENS